MGNYIHICLYTYLNGDEVVAVAAIRINAVNCEWTICGHTFVLAARFVCCVFFPIEFSKNLGELLRECFKLRKDKKKTTTAIRICELIMKNKASKTPTAHTYI